MQTAPTTAPVSPDLEVRLLQTLALEIGRAEDLAHALSAALREIGRTTGWVAGESWLPDRRGRAMVRGPVWSDSRRALEPFHTVSDGIAFPPGSGLVGWVWTRGTPRWVSNITQDPEFRRAEAGSRAEAPRPVALDEALARALATLHPRIRETAAEVTSEPLPEVIGGAAELTYVFEQLLTNALTFRTPGVAPRVAIAARAHDASWIVSIRDNGIGIVPEKQVRVFDAFPRLHARGAYPGRGVGLAICRKIIESFGGRIWVESDVGSGSTLLFSLPAPRRLVDEAWSPTPAEPAPVATR